MFRTMLPCSDATQAKTHYRPAGMCYLNANGTRSMQQAQTEATHARQRDVDYHSLAQSIGAYATKVQQRMSRPSTHTQALSAPAFAALCALQSANDVWAEREAAHACSLHARSTTSVSESVSATEESSPVSHDEEDDASTSSMNSTRKNKCCILRDLQRLVKRERSASQAAAPSEEACDADDAVSESGVFGVDGYSSVAHRRDVQHEDAADAQPFKLYRDAHDREALIEELFQREDDDALIQRIFFPPRRAVPRGCNEGSAGGFPS